MGSCHSPQAEIPASSFKSSILPKKKQQFPQSIVLTTPNLQERLQPYTSNSKITDFITKNEFPIANLYKTTNLESMLDRNKKFVDKQFPASKQSLGPQPYKENVVWERASQFFKEQFQIFEGIIQPKDIKQGHLGDCYLLSAISSISQYPFIVKRIFQTTQISTYGYYGIWLFVDGLWHSIIIDDYFPTYNGKMFYANSNQNQIWVMLLEKAYAKVFKNYQNIENGLTGIALNALTGAPYQYLIKDDTVKLDADATWDFISKHFEQHHLISVSTQNNNRNEYLGLASKHAYALLDIQEVFIAIKNGKKRQRILKLKNPWGNYEWKGRWSDYCDVWSQQLRAQLHFIKGDDGIFWMNIEDLVETFHQVCVCKFNKNYISTSLPISFSKQIQNEFKAVFLRTTNRVQGYLSLIQQDHRKHGKNYLYSLVRMIVLKIDKSTNTLSTFISDLMDCDRDGTLQLELDPGDYYILIEIDWKSSFTRDAVIQFYGQHPVSLAEDKNPIKIQQLFNEIVVLHEKFTQKDRIFEYPKDPRIKRVTGNIAGYIYYHYTNKSLDSNYLCETVTLKERKYIQVIDEKEKGEFTVKLNVDEEKIVRMKVNKDGNSNYSYSTKIQHYLVEKYSLAKLKQMADRKPTKVKKRQIQGKQIDVRVKTLNYSGGIAILYQNKLDKYAYIEEIVFEIDNLQLQNEQLRQGNKLQIQLEPHQQKLLSFIVSSPGKEIIFRTKMTFYLNAPQFKF